MPKKSLQRIRITLSSHAVNRSGSKNPGFALIAALGIMGFLVLLGIGLYSLASVHLAVSSQSLAQTKARANARMALMVALGELQKTAGPDRRISARAGLLANDPRINAAEIEDDTPKSWWVGILGSDPEYGIDATNPVSSSNPAAVWLVSGLNPQADPATQIQNPAPFDAPVVMFDSGSINTATLTGGQALTAGLVTVNEADLNRISGFAYFIDDEGLKAALVPSDPDLVNQNRPASSSAQTPGIYDLSILDGMGDLNGTDVASYSRLNSTNDISLIASSSDIAQDKRFSYTLNSRGVLSDVKNGGLKRDLTVAFEDDTTFDEVFPRSSGNYTADYLCIDPDKLAQSAELQQNGYIHWEIFKDHYNIKRHIKTHTDGTKYLDPVRYSKDGPFLPYQFNGAVNPSGQPAGGGRGSLFMAGRLGPHEIGNTTTAQYSEMNGMPYGDFSVDDAFWPAGSKPKNHREFKHSPVIPILQRFQANAWMEQLDARTLRSHSQIWSSHYNPYNISLYVSGWEGGPRLLGTPTVRPFSSALHDGGNQRRFVSLHENQNSTGNRKIAERFNDINFNSFKFEFQGKDPVMLEPGRSHVMAYEDNAQIGVDATADGALYSDKIQDLTVQSVYRDLEYFSRNPTTGEYDIPLDLPPGFDLRIRMFLMNISMHQGVGDNNGGPGNHELSQTFWAPFAWENINNRPGKEFNFGTVTSATLNENMMASIGFNLRTTREAGSTIRPLVDANIRSMFGNTRWDSPLGVSLLASYTPENDGVMDDMIMEMDPVDAPKGYTYWGAGRDSGFGTSRVILFDIPRSDLLSLGQLQHAGAGRFSYEPTYIVGNSYANARIAQEEWRESITDSFSTAARGLANYPINGNFNLYDASYLVNEVLWDAYIFTTIPQVADNLPLPAVSEPATDDAHFTALATGAAKLQNARYIPYAPPGSAFDLATLQMVSDKATGTGAFYHNAGHLLVDGPFNVNSTSVDAWEAFLSSTHALPFLKLDEDGEISGFDSSATRVRFPRVQAVFGEGVTKDALDENFWTGFRELEQPEVRELAAAIVAQIKLRGPFLSLADFVNRKLVSGDQGEAGALQTALDQTVNAGLDSDFAEGGQGAGFPGQLLQGDLLQALAPYMMVRSDVFTIRTYGEYREAGPNGKILSRVWAEAKVQRYPDPVDEETNAGLLENLSNPTSAFGRKFKIVSFRWLSPEEV